MIQMLSKLHISMTSCCDVEISLYFIPFQTPINPACLLVIIPPSLWRLFELSFPLFPLDLSKHVFRMKVFLLLSLSSCISTIQNMYAFTVYPVIPTRAVFGQSVPSKYSIA